MKTKTLLLSFTNEMQIIIINAVIIIDLILVFTHKF